MYDSNCYKQEIRLILYENKGEIRKTYGSIILVDLVYQQIQCTAHLIIINTSEICTII